MAAAGGQRAFHLGLAALILIGLALRMVTLWTSGFSIDDIFTTMIVRPPNSFDSLVVERAIRIEANPPLYYLLAAAWQAVVGIGEVKLKALSALLGALAIRAAYLLGRSLFPRRVLLMQAALLACSYGAILTGYAARPYALLLLLGAVLTCLYFSAERNWRETGCLSAGRLLPLCLAGTLAAYTHYFGLIFAGAIFAALLLQALWRRQVGAALKSAGFGILTLALFAPWLLYEVPRQQRIIEEVSLFWFPERAGEYLGQVITFAAYLGGSSYGAAILFFAFLAVLWAGRERLKAPETLPRARALGHCILLPALALALIVLLNFVAPLSFARFFVVLLPVLYLGLALAFDLWLERAEARGRGWFAMLPVLLLIALPLHAAWRFLEKPEDSSQQAVDFVTRELGCTEGVVPTYQAAEFPDGLVAYNYYLEREGRDLRAETVERADGTMAPLPGQDPACRLVLWMPSVYLEDPAILAEVERGLGLAIDPESKRAEPPAETEVIGPHYIYYEPAGG